MIYLLCCIGCSSLLVFMFRVFAHYQVSVFPAIVINYLTCVICGLVHEGISPLTTFHTIFTSHWLWLGIVLGISFIYVFNLTSVTTLHFGVATASLAMKLGLVIPVAFAFILYHEPITWYKVLGICCALVAVMLSSIKDKPDAVASTKSSSWLVLLPALVLIGSGLCDSGAQLSSKLYFPTGGSDNFVLTTFLFAGLAGIVYLLYAVRQGSYKLAWNQVIGGIALGIPNYGSLLFLMKALDQVEGGSSVVFPVINIATVAGSTMLSVVFFKEYLNLYNRLGLIFAALCIGFIYWNKIVGG